MRRANTLIGRRATIVLLAGGLGLAACGRTVSNEHGVDGSAGAPGRGSGGSASGDDGRGTGTVGSGGEAAGGGASEATATRGQSAGGGEAGGGATSGAGGLDPGTGVSISLPPRLQQPTTLRLAADDGGNMFVSGNGYAPAAFGLEGEGGDYPFLVKLDASGQALASIAFPEGIMADALALGPDNTVWLSGSVYRPASFGGETLGPLQDGFYLAEFSHELAPILSFAVERPDYVSVQGLAVDALGNVYVTGPEGSGLGQGVLLQKYSGSGDLLWSRSYPGTDTTAMPRDLALAPDGDVFLAGYFNVTLTFERTLRSTGIIDGLPGYNAFMARVDPDSGDAVLSERYGGSYLDYWAAVDVLGSGALRVAGQANGPGDFGGLSVTASDEGSAIVAQLATDGTASWATVLGGKGHVSATASNAELTYAVGRVDAPGGIFTDAEPSSFVAVIADEGVIVTTKTFPTLTANGAGQTALDRAGGLWVAGEFVDDIDFGFGTLSTGDDYASFLVRFPPGWFEE